MTRRDGVWLAVGAMLQEVVRDVLPLLIVAAVTKKRVRLL